MKSIFDDLDISVKIFLNVQYQTILQELYLEKTHGQIVRRLVSEGYSISQAEDLYQKVSANQEEIKAIIVELTKTINEKKAEQDKGDKILYNQQQQKDKNEREMIASWHKSEEELHSFNELVHFLKHESHHFITHAIHKIIFPH